MKLEINYKKKTGKNTNTWELNNMIPKNYWVIEKTERNLKKYLEQMKTETQHTKIYEMPQKWFKKEVHENTELPQKEEKSLTI